MAFEIDFIPVGEGERNGDAIAVRYGEPGAYTVMIYDGGTKASGTALVQHVKKYYQTDYVDHVVSSHPDQDHASGLSIVLEELNVGTLWMHRPWQHSHLILEYFRDGRITNQSLKDRLQGKMSDAYKLEQLALKKGVTIKEPFQGMQIGEFYILSPERDWYIHDLIAEFEKSPDQKTYAAAAAMDNARNFGAFRVVADAVKKAVKWVAERWDMELLREGVETSAENESSAILYAYMKEEKEGVLLTGDAGVKALKRALDYLDSHNVSAAKLIKFYQIPHHGGRHNVSPSVLDRLVGPRLLGKPEKFEKRAYVSASSESAYPRNMVRNAFVRRGAEVVATKGWYLRYSRGMPDRGWSAVTPLEFTSEVEAWD
jgi:beta-lactamase superfamily II metal-dependent hydrolase